MPLVRLTILAVTRMDNGICVAGVDGTRTWIRPVTPPPDLNFTKESLSERGRIVVEPYSEIEFHVRARLNNSPQGEDHEIDVSQEPHMVRTLTDGELIALMGALDEHDSVGHQGSRDAFVGWLTDANRSLVLTRVDRVNSAYRGSGDYGRRPRRLSFRVGTTNFDMSCTDLRWRSITRGDRDVEALNRLSSSPNLYFALGLTRQYRGSYWPMVVGVHPIPRLTGTVDYDRL
jgi:hypothetical protein